MKTNNRTEPIPSAATWAGTGEAARSSTSRRIRWTAAAAGAVLALAPLAACGSDAVASESAGSSDASSAGSDAGAADALADCLAENGIETTWDTKVVALIAYIQSLGTDIDMILEAEGGMAQ